MYVFINSIKTQQGLMYHKTQPTITKNMSRNKYTSYIYSTIFFVKALLQFYFWLQCFNAVQNVCE